MIITYKAYPFEHDYGMSVKFVAEPEGIWINRADYEQLRNSVLALAAECDGIEGLGSGVIAQRIRTLIGEQP